MLGNQPEQRGRPCSQVWKPKIDPKEVETSTGVSRTWEVGEGGWLITQVHWLWDSSAASGTGLVEVLHQSNPPRPG